jgi:hypothetical protein
MPGHHTAAAQHFVVGMGSYYEDTHVDAALFRYAEMKVDRYRVGNCYEKIACPMTGKTPG